MAKGPQKLVQIPFRTHICKYLCVHGKWTSEGHLNFGKRAFPIIQDNTVIIRKYLADRDRKITVPVLMTPSSIYHQYAMVHYFDKRFFEEMTMYVDVRKHQDRVFKPLRDFLQIYGITYDDYDFDSAWKRYQREIVRRKRDTVAVYEQHK